MNASPKPQSTTEPFISKNGVCANRPVRSGWKEADVRLLSVSNQHLVLSMPLLLIMGTASFCLFEVNQEIRLAIGSGDATIHWNDRTVHEAGIFACKEGDHPRDLLRERGPA